MATTNRTNRSQRQPIGRISTSSEGGGAMSSTRVSERTANATRRAARRTASGTPRQDVHSGDILHSLIGIAIVIGVLALVAFVAIPRIFSGITERHDIEAGLDVELVIPEGSGASAIADILYDEGVISSKQEFSRQLRRQEAESSLQSGAYHFLTLMNEADVVRQLVEGPNSTKWRITIPEGLTVAKTAALIESTFDIPADQFIAQAKASNYADEYSFLSEARDDSLEGFLYPLTYDFAGQEVTADLIIRTMLDTYKNQVANLDFAAAEEALAPRFGINFSDYDILRIASIIEREALEDEDRPLIASVFYNRLMINMPLQSDATTEYIVGHTPSPEELQVDDPYNTYTNYGLPPTPICSPSIESIKAAMDPERTDNYYFYVVPGYSAFSETLDQHQQAIDNAPANSSD